MLRLRSPPRDHSHRRLGWFAPSCSSGAISLRKWSGWRRSAGGRAPLVGRGSISNRSVYTAVVRTARRASSEKHKGVNQSPISSRRGCPLDGVDGDSRFFRVPLLRKRVRAWVIGETGPTSAGDAHLGTRPTPLPEMTQADPFTLYGGSNLSPVCPCARRKAFFVSEGKFTEKVFCAGDRSVAWTVAKAFCHWFIFSVCWTTTWLG
jgi:hypothetical protein